MENANIGLQAGIVTTKKCHFVDGASHFLCLSPFINFSQPNDVLRLAFTFQTHKRVTREGRQVQSTGRPTVQYLLGYLPHQRTFQEK